MTRKIFACLTALMISASMLCSCSQSPSDADTDGAEQTQQSSGAENENLTGSDNAVLEYLQRANKLSYVELSIGGQTVRLDMNGAAYIELNTLNCENDLSVSYTGHEDYSVTFAGIPLAAGETISYRVPRLDKNDTITVDVEDSLNGGKKTFYIATWPSTIPGYTIVGQSPYEGDYYLTTMSSSGQDNIAMKIGQDGMLKYYFYNPSGCIADFKKVNTPDGVRYLLFSTIDSRYYTKGCSQHGCYIVMDEEYREINRLFMKKTDHVPADDFPVDQHDCLYISDNEYYLISYVDKNVYNIPDIIAHKANGTLVTAAVIQGIRDGEVFFEWDSTDYPEFYGLSVDYNDYTNRSGIYSADYMHINSISLDPKDGNLLISCRNIDTVFKINSQTGDVMWKLSGLGDEFGLDESQKTSRQHYANYTDLGSITVFDNGNANAQTRIVEYWLNEDGLTLEGFKEYKIDGYFSFATGSVQRIDNNSDVFVIGWGYRIVGQDGTNSLYPQFSEIDFSTGRTLFEFRFEDPYISTYRCVKCR